MTALAFRVYGEAEPQGSARAFTPKRWTRSIITSDNPALKSWRQLVKEAASQALGAIPESERRLLQDGVRLSIAFYLPRPKSLPKRATAHTKKPDVDKLARGCADALSATVYRDDSQICELIVGKYYAADGENPHCDIRVEPTQGLRPRELVAAHAPIFEQPLLALEG